MEKVRVIAGTATWMLSGVNVFTANLIRGLRALGVEAEILLTAPHARNGLPMPAAPDLPFTRLPVAPGASLRRRWAALIAYLEGRAPCVYLPGADFPVSCVCAKLSRRVSVVGVVHSDYVDHYEHVERLGRYWDAVVAVSKAVEEGTARTDPSLKPRLATIPSGVAVPEQCPRRPQTEDPALRLVFASRLVQLAKRVHDLPGLAAALAERNVPFRLTIVGDGEEREPLLGRLRPFLADGRVRYLGTLANEDLLREFERNDVILITSDFEGLPVGLLEAMGRGCVPVVTDIPSGIPELVRDGVNGYRVPVGDLAAFADRLAGLQADTARRQEFALRAHEAVCRGGYRTEDMAARYLALFRRALHDAAAGAFRRPRGKIRLPPELGWMQPTWKDWLPGPVRAVGMYCKAALRWAYSAVAGPRGAGAPPQGR